MRLLVALHRYSMTVLTMLALTKIPVDFSDRSVAAVR
jgi:hypothetical protein